MLVYSNRWGQRVPLDNEIPSLNYKYHSTILINLKSGNTMIPCPKKQNRLSTVKILLQYQTLYYL